MACAVASWTAALKLRRVRTKNPQWRGRGMSTQDSVSKVQERLSRPQQPCRAASALRATCLATAPPLEGCPAAKGLGPSSATLLCSCRRKAESDNTAGGFNYISFPLFLSFLLLWPPCSIWKFPGQGSDPGRRHDLRCSCGNAGSLYLQCWARDPTCILVLQRCRRVHCAPAGSPFVSCFK